MSFTGKLGLIGSLPGDMILGGKGPAVTGSAIDVDASSALSLSSVARSASLDVSASSALSLTQATATPTPHHAAATSTLAPTVTARSSIKMLTASSALSLAQNSNTTTIFPVASSILALVSTARATTLIVSASSAISLTSTGRCNKAFALASSSISLVSSASATNVRNPLSSVLTLTQVATANGPVRKSASTALTVTQVAVGTAPFKKSASSAITLTDTASHKFKYGVASSQMVLSDSAHAATPYPVAATSPITITVVAVGINSHVYASSALTLTDVADTSTKRRSVTDTITLTSTATADKVKTVRSVLSLTQEATQGILTLTATNALELVDQARNSAIKVVGSPTVINLTQEAHSNIKMLSASNSLTIQQVLGVIRPWRVSASNALTTITSVFDIDTFTFIDVVSGLTQSATVLVQAPRHASNIISFATTATQSHARADGTDLDATSTLSLSSTARLSKQATNEPQHINITQSATAVTGIAAASDLSTLNVVASVRVVRANLTASNTLELTHAVSFIFEQGDTLCTYSPFVGSSSDPNAPTPPPSTYTAPGATPGFRLQYPASGSVSDELILRNPNLGNIDRLSMVRINRESRGGTLIVFADPIWPKVESMLLSFSGLSQQQGQDLMTFMEGHIGEEIRLIDWEDRLWRGVIVNPQDPVVQDGPGCRYTASYEFEGEKV